MSDEITTETTNEGAAESAAPETKNTPEQTDGKSAVGVFADRAPPKDLGRKVRGRATKEVTEKTAEAPAQAPVLPAYVPNYKFKVLDQEKEMEEWLRPLVKSKEMEEKIRDMLTKAHGLTKIKSERDEVKTQFDGFRNQVIKDYMPVLQRHQMLSKMADEGRQNGDWGKFFQSAQIPVQSVIRWAANTVAQLEKNPNYLDQERNTFQTSQNLQNLQTQNETLRQQMEQFQMQKQELELDYTLRSPEIDGFAKAFDSRVGQPGSFRREVIRRGALIEMTEKRVASTQEIVSELQKFYGGSAPASQTMAQAEPTLPEGNLGVQQGSEGKPVLPNIKGRPSSPAKTMVRSTDDLRKLHASMVASG